MTLVAILLVGFFLMVSCVVLFGRIPSEPESWYADELELARAIREEILKAQKTQDF